MKFPDMLLTASHGMLCLMYAMAPEVRDGRQSQAKHIKLPYHHFPVRLLGSPSRELFPVRYLRLLPNPPLPQTYDVLPPAHRISWTQSIAQLLHVPSRPIIIRNSIITQCTPIRIQQQALKVPKPRIPPNPRLGVHPRRGVLDEFDLDLTSSAI